MNKPFICLLAALTLAAGALPAAAQGTAFSYQGQLQSGGGPANGSYDLTFKLFTGPTNSTSLVGPITNSATGVTNGLFTTLVDFGPGAFTGAGIWIEIAARTNATGNFVTLTPRQQVNPTPYAVYAEEANAAGLTGTVPLAQLPASLVTNNQSSVTLSNVTFTGKLLLPYPAVIYTQDGPAPFVDCDSSDVYLGIGAGTYGTYPGVYNTGIGVDALESNVTGAGNTAVGYSAMAGNNSFGSGNTAVGYATLAGNISGPDNAALGDQALYNNLSGGDNTASGYEALYYNQSGANNTADGALALFANKSGNYNVAIGNGALQNNTNSDNTAEGYEALWNLTSGGNNLAFGYEAGYGLTTGNNNIYLGNAGVNESGVIRLGTPGLQTSTYIAGVINGNGGGLTNLNLNGASLTQLLTAVVTNNEPIVSLGSLFLNNGLSLGGNLSFSSATPIVYAAGSRLLYSDANNNSSFGLLAGSGGGNNNTALGAGALSVNANGNNNVATGSGALQNDTASYNTADGGYALQNNTSGNNNVAVGYNALNANTTGINNTASGFDALQNSTAGYNTAAGGYALQNLQAGSYNIALGYNAGNDLINGGNNIYIGNTGADGDANVIRIGGSQTTTYIAGVIQSPSVTSITITGGSDLAEPFAISPATQPVSEGEVVVIDEANPGQLKLTDRPYDTRVAGVVSGANGIHPGIQMHQQGLLEGGRNVALTGRVYVQADASNGAILPGDLLTTSSTPGQAMRVSDHSKAQGAILGKAMTALKAGHGMVLVLVTLQ